MKLLTTILLATSLTFACGGDPEEQSEEAKAENLETSDEVSLFGKTYRIDNDSLFRAECNQFYIHFILDANNACTATTVDYEVKHNADYSEVWSEFTIGGDKTWIKRNAGVWENAEGVSYKCYIYNGSTYTQDGTQKYFGSHMILSKTAATNYGDLNLADVEAVYTNADHCEGLYD